MPSHSFDPVRIGTVAETGDAGLNGSAGSVAPSTTGTKRSDRSGPLLSALKTRRLRRLDVQAAKQELGSLGGAVGPQPADRSLGQRAHDDGAVEQAARRWKGREHRRLAAAARLPEDGDVSRVAAEPRDVVTHPFERQHEVA